MLNFQSLSIVLFKFGNLLLVCCVLLIFIGVFIGVKIYLKNKIQKTTDNLLDEIQRNNLEAMEVQKKNVSELDTMKEMEIYRKEYIGNISHELKTPLFLIQGYLETLIDGGIENLNIRDKYLERIGKSVERLLDIVKDLDMINQYESGKITLQLSRFDLNLLIKEIFDLLEMEAQKTEAVLSLQTGNSQLFVLADKQKISQVIINLVSNAIHYANREKPKILVKTNPLKNKILVQVEDNGMGIKPDILPRIFERFYRVESSRNRKDGGSGLGLAIVKHILEAHNETISVESVYLEGTKFSFLLDRA
ncbi:MAG: two-component sensor histidine kinase [Flavobacteriaceae bacterium]|jgi:two-component system phosphate regulon sensor histidine kinase PhoR|nr:two-component sensor histidine kinase [Flavobacteriaceae bacterium]